MKKINFIDIKSMGLNVRICALALMFTLPVKASENDHDHVDNSGIELTTRQQANSGIEVSTVELSYNKVVAVAPAEVINNDFATELVSIAVPSQVKKRYVSLGEKVKSQQKLATLYSYEVAKAQIRYRLAEDEWQRVTKLKGEAVSEKAYLLGKAEREAAASQLRDYGFNESDIINTQKKHAKQLGLYTIYAQLEGTILQEQLTLGRRFSGGEVIAKISNEAQVWVQARLPQDQDLEIYLNSKISILHAGQRFMARLLQAGHSIDPKTRTALIRVVVDNPNHMLHAGMFVKTEFVTAGTEPQLLISRGALSQSADGDWQVFIESEPGHYVVKEIKITKDYGEQVEVTGLMVGEQLVTGGVFFLNAQAAKSNFDVHSH
ncbi:efflux RND transporter periplasmic adaptor subunit [Pseudoalteromonas sp. MMG013]|uniref:efflux RND transporter periplasmic adaptor subunit n=1 Tax=Pseudoalteromonas sp. MMG013 TaxID=2822687 RepID=UPI001B372F84|nr:efflux RND transporter periplasmic adaptor subunit [Pseudoalteromonas sp. MMG013]MBQ4860124.1 efflux RND transporter periplasmic adaptor subunit [Pseudoalteromonas sp. MMG013]